MALPSKYPSSSSYRLGSLLTTSWSFELQIITWVNTYGLTDWYAYPYMIVIVGLGLDIRHSAIELGFVMDSFVGQLQRVVLYI